MKPGDRVDDTQGTQGTVIRVVYPPRRKEASRAVQEEVYVLWHVPGVPRAAT